MKSIDLNCDLGEGQGPDRELMRWITSANIACGAHAGDPETMRETVRLALESGVAIGAHPGYADPEHFGRMERTMPEASLKALIQNQILALKEIVEEEGGRLHHVKLHGALYNQAARDPEIARVFLEAVREVDSGLKIYGMPMTALHSETVDAGLVFVAEGFADRAYDGPGQLTPRSEAGAVIHAIGEVVERALAMARLSRAKTSDGREIPIRVQTLCIHGDTAGALEMLKSLHKALRRAEIAIQSHENAVRFLILGESAVLVRFENQDSAIRARRVVDLRSRIEQEQISGVVETVPSRIELAVFFDPDRLTPIALTELIGPLVQETGDDRLESIRSVEIPVCYDQEFGPDLARLAEDAGLGIDEVIALHEATPGSVAMMGFKPGFAYITGVDPRIDHPRLKTPRTRIPAGTVAVADGMTGIYPVEGPGGWLQIGRTPLRVFDPDRADPFLLSPGAHVRFRRIDRKTYEELTASHPESTIPVPEPSFTLEHPGLATVVVDGGRNGYRAYGVTPAGAMDPDAMKIANRLVGNSSYAPALEWTGWGPAFHFMKAATAALTGGDFGARLNGELIERYQSFRIAPGDVLSMGPALQGFRGYLAVSGGIEGQSILGSLSMDLSTGLCGGPLKKGDGVATGTSSRPGCNHAVELMTSLMDGIRTIRILAGPESERLSPDGWKTFLGQTFTIGNASDRMGYRLEGPCVESEGDAEILSSAVTFGTIQLPGDGHPIIMMAEHQTTGGYARIGQVVRADLGVLAQSRPGEMIHFKLVSQRAARGFSRERAERIERLTGRSLRHFEIRVNGRRFDVGLEEILDEV